VPDQIMGPSQSLWNVESGVGPVSVSGTLLVSDNSENQRILDYDDAVTTINYNDSGKDSVNSIVTSSIILGRKVTDDYNNSGATTLVLTRSVADV